MFENKIKVYVIGGIASIVLIWSLLYISGYSVNVTVSYGLIEVDNGKLGTAVRNYSLEEIESLIDIYPEAINEVFYGGMTPLATAINAGRPEVVSLLISRGADVNFPRDYSPLVRAINLREAEIVEILVENGADAVSEEDRLTPFEWAQRTGRQDIVEIIEAAMNENI